MNSKEQVVYGPKNVDKSIDEMSLGRLLYDSLSRDHSHIIIVENETGEEISREKLLHTSIKIAAYLKEQGINKNDVIGIMSVNCWKYFAITISAFFIGATAALMNPRAPSDELRHYLLIGKPTILFISNQLWNVISTLCKELAFIQVVILFDEHTDGNKITIEDILNKDIDPATFQIEKEKTDAFILYSSGTTGLPKGVILTQDNIINCYKDVLHPDYVVINKTTVLLGYLPLFHIFSMLFSLICLITGKRIVVMDKFKPDEFLQAITKHKINTLTLVPPTILFLAKYPLTNNYDLTSIEKIFSSGAPLGKEIAELIFKRFNIKIRQMYGLTETTAVTCMPENNIKLGSVGKVMTNHQIKIVNRDTGDIIEPHEIGEICFKGRSVMRGYKDNEEATRKSIDEDGYFHTGDCGYFDKDEYLYIVDRIKELIKYKGCQVPPAYLEDILCKHPDVKDAGVVGKPDERAGELPMAFIVRQLNSNITENELVVHVAEKVSPEWQLHGGVTFVDSIPKTASGKILRRDLRKLLQ